MDADETKDGQQPGKEQWATFSNGQDDGRQEDERGEDPFDG